MSVPLAYIGIVLIWSTTPLAIQWSSVGPGFAFAVFARMFIGALLCLALHPLLRTPLPRDAQAWRTYVIAGGGLFGAMATTYWGAQYIPSGWVSVLFGLTPLFTSVMAFVWLEERSLTPGKIGGVLLGFAGLLAIFRSSLHLGPHAGYGIAALLCSVAIYCASMVWVKRTGAKVPALAVTTGALWVALPGFFLMWWLLDGTWPHRLTPRALSAIVYLGVFGSVLGFVLYYYVIKHLAAGSVALITLLTPAFALVLGVELNHEHMSRTVIAGVVCISLGVVLHQWGDRIIARRGVPV